MTETTWSVGLPSLSAATHVPANFFSFSRPGCVAGAGAPAGLSSARTGAPRAKSTRPPTRNRCIMSFSQGEVEAQHTPHQGEEVYCCPLSARGKSVLYCDILHPDAKP